MHKKAFGFIPLPRSHAGGERSGITMVLDKGLGINAARDLMSVGGDYIDIVKFGWATTRLLPRKLVKDKNRLYRRHGIRTSPGGTFMELAASYDMVDRFLREAKGLGFSCIEVSDGVMPMGDRKLRIIERAKRAGFTVVSEVGKKSASDDARMELKERVDAIRRELDAGSWKVILEGRESGVVGVFDKAGAVKADMVRDILAAVGKERIIFEAPRKEQQVWFIMNYDADVNLGNIAPEDVISVETLRRGLRADTLMKFHSREPRIRIGMGPAEALDASKRGDVVVVIDALRASSTIVTALAHGLSAVKPVSSVEECVGELTAGERGGKKIPHLSYDNSPVAFADRAHQGKTLVLTTTNGTECIKAAVSSGKSVVLIGALLNATVVARQAYGIAKKRSCNITLVIAGRNNVPTSEDMITATEMTASLPSCLVQSSMELIRSADFTNDFLRSESGANLTRLGKEKDVVFSAQKDLYSVIPVWRRGRIVALKQDAR